MCLTSLAESSGNSSISFPRLYETEILSKKDTINVQYTFDFEVITLTKESLINSFYTDYTLTLFDYAGLHQVLITF